MTQRMAFTMTLKQGALAEYKKHHDEIWPELVEEIKRSGIHRFSIFVRDKTLFLDSEVDSPTAWDRLWHSDVHQRWSKIMDPLMNVDAEGIVESSPLTEIFHIDTSADGA